MILAQVRQTGSNVYDSKTCINLTPTMVAWELNPIEHIVMRSHDSVFINHLVEAREHYWHTEYPIVPAV